MHRKIKEYLDEAVGRGAKGLHLTCLIDINKASGIMHDLWVKCLGGSPLSGDSPCNYPTELYVVSGPDSVKKPIKYYSILSNAISQEQWTAVKNALYAMDSHTKDNVYIYVNPTKMKLDFDVQFKNYPQTARYLSESGWYPLWGQDASRFVSKKINL